MEQRYAVNKTFSPRNRRRIPGATKGEAWCHVGAGIDWTRGAWTVPGTMPHNLFESGLGNPQFDKERFDLQVQSERKFGKENLSKTIQSEHSNVFIKIIEYITTDVKPEIKLIESKTLYVYLNKRNIKECILI